MLTRAEAYDITTTPQSYMENENRSQPGEPHSPDERRIKTALFVYPSYHIPNVNGLHIKMFKIGI